MGHKVKDLEFCCASRRKKAESSKLKATTNDKPQTAAGGGHESLAMSNERATGARSSINN
jgi:hypothetical protein